MKQEIPKPVLIIAIIAAVLLAIFIGKSALSGSARPSKDEMAKFAPSWIDPATNKPRVNSMPQTGGGPSSGGAPAGSSGGQ